eukprot:scaffold112364_cov21-Tisochrysis_lutea.AAC.1
MSAGLRLVARLEEPNCLPVVGNDAYSLEAPGTLSTALELYHLQGEEVAGVHGGTTTYFLQQRAPAMKGRQAEFAANLADWLQREGVQQVVITNQIVAVDGACRSLSSVGSMQCPGKIARSWAHPQ